MIYNRRFAEEVQVWLDELRDEAYINIISGQKTDERDSSSGVDPW